MKEKYEFGEEWEEYKEGKKNCWSREILKKYGWSQMRKWKKEKIKNNQIKKGRKVER